MFLPLSLTILEEKKIAVVTVLVTQVRNLFFYSWCPCSHEAAEASGRDHAYFRCLLLYKSGRK